MTLTENIGPSDDVYIHLTIHFLRCYIHGLSDNACSPFIFTMSNSLNRRFFSLHRYMLALLKGLPFIFTTIGNCWGDSLFYFFFLLIVNLCIHFTLPAAKCEIKIGISNPWNKFRHSSHPEFWFFLPPPPPNTKNSQSQICTHSKVKYSHLICPLPNSEFLGPYPWISNYLPPPPHTHTNFILTKQPSVSSVMCILNSFTCQNT